MMKIEILGTGCPKCRKLEEIVRLTVAKLGVDAEVIHVSDIDEILEYGVMSTPALVINGKIWGSGRIPSEGEMERLLRQALNKGT